MSVLQPFLAFLGRATEFTVLDDSGFEVSWLPYASLEGLNNILLEGTEWLRVLADEDGP